MEFHLDVLWCLAVQKPVCRCFGIQARRRKSGGGYGRPIGFTTFVTTEIFAVKVYLTLLQQRSNIGLILERLGGVVWVSVLVSRAQRMEDKQSMDSFSKSRQIAQSFTCTSLLVVVSQRKWQFAQAKKRACFVTLFAQVCYRTLAASLPSHQLSIRLSG